MSKTSWWWRKALGLDRLYYIEKKTVELNNLGELKTVFGWTLDPVRDDSMILPYKNVEDANQRTRRDAESIGATVINLKPQICLEIGTGFGVSTAQIASNAPDSEIYTVNIPPEGFDKAGKFATGKLETNEIGAFYREKKLENIHQIYANTANWKPDLENIDFAYIDGCHDTWFVINDTVKALKKMKSGGFLLWHDFNPSLRSKYPWIFSVCRGINRLYGRKILTADIFHLRDSWVGIYRIP